MKIVHWSVSLCIQASVSLALLVWGACVLGGCSAGQSTGSESGLNQGSVLAQVESDGATYQEMFSAARQVLTELRFGINRVDAARGVITTFPKRTDGLASLWDSEQSSLGQELEDLAHQQERTIRVLFKRTAGGAGNDSVEGAADGEAGRVEASVEVIVNRVHRPNWRIEAQSVRLSTHAHSRDHSGAVEPTEFREPIGQDVALAQRIAREIAKKLNQ